MRKKDTYTFKVTNTSNYVDRVLVYVLQIHILNLVCEAYSILVNAPISAIYDVKFTILQMFKSYSEDVEL